MRLGDMKDYLENIKAYEVKDKLYVISKYVMGCMMNPDHGKKDITKDQFINDFYKWKEDEYKSMEYEPRISLDRSIPEDTLMDVRFIPLNSYMTGLGPDDECYLWLIQLHGEKPLFKTSEGKMIPVNATCRTFPVLKDTSDSKRKNLHVSCIILGDKKLYGETGYIHILKHELTHMIINIIDGEDAVFHKEILEKETDPVSSYNFYEFIADFLPYTTIYSHPIKEFRKSLNIKFVPKYSDTYEKILDLLFEYDNSLLEHTIK